MCRRGKRRPLTRCRSLSPKAETTTESGSRASKPAISASASSRPATNNPTGLKEENTKVYADN